ncbi:MAG: hypothetical protein WC217_00655 [Candidatus Paceibacterota bacterium]|jgi:Tfp pilus assembly protein PilO
MNSRILPSVALLVAIGIFFIYINPTWTGSIAETKAAIALDDQALAAASEYSAQQNTLASARAAIDPSNLTRLEIFLPDSVDNVGLILDLNALAARSGLSLSNIDVVTNDSGSMKSVGTSLPGALPAADQNPIGSVNLSLAAVGTFSSLQAFLSGIERSARLLDVQDIVVKGSETGVYTYQMTLRLYWLR